MIENVIAEAEPQPSLVARAVAGDEVAFARIVAAYHGDMARRPSRRRGPSLLAA